MVVTGFSIGDKGYVGTGNLPYGNFISIDFWAYDPATDVWTQRANASTSARQRPVSLSDGSNGYFCTGRFSSEPLNDTWKFNPGTNQWLQQPPFPGGKRVGAAGFSLGGKLYMGTGRDQDNSYNDFWEYNPA